MNKNYLMRIFLFLAGATFSAIAAAGPAGNVVYDFGSPTTWANLALNGSITTDGSTGILTSSSIVAYSFSVSDGTTTFNFSSSDASSVSCIPDCGASVDSTANTLNLIDPGYSGSGNLQFIDTTTNASVTFYQGLFSGLDASTVNAPPGSGISILEGPALTLSSVTSPVPEPHEYAMLCLGLALLGFIAWRQPKHLQNAFI